MSFVIKSGIGTAEDSALSYSQKAMVYACLGTIIQRAQRLAVVYTHSAGRMITTKEDLAKCLKVTIMDVGEQIEQVAVSAIENKPLSADLDMGEEDAMCIANLYQKCMTELVQGREHKIKYGSFIQDTVMAEDDITVAVAQDEEDEDESMEETQSSMAAILRDCGTELLPQDIVDEIDAREQDWSEWHPQTLTQRRMWDAVQRME